METTAKNATDVTFIIVRNDKALMQHRTDDAPRYPGAWCFPGGGIEKNEDSLSAVVRETMEEYHLKVSRERCRHLITYEHDGTDVDAVYVCEIDPDQEPKLHEGKAFAWRTLREIRNEKLGFEQERLLPLLSQFLPY